MAKRLLVEGLSWGVNDQQLARVFAPFGELAEAKVAIDWATGRSRGFGSVTVIDSDDAEAAIAGLDGQKLAGKSLRVMVAPEQGQRPAYRSGDFGYTDPSAPPAKGVPFRNADFDPPRAPRTDRKLFRSADFGYVEEAAAPAAAAPPEPAPGTDLPAAEKKAPERNAGRGAEAAKAAAAKKSEEGEGLDDEERANRAKFGGWREVDDNDGGQGGGGNPFG